MTSHTDAPGNSGPQVFAQEQAELEERGLPDGIAAVDTPFPDAALLDARGAATTMHAALSGGPAVVVFYRGTWCPYCNRARHAYQEELLPELDRRRVKLIAISPMKPDGSLTMKEKHDLMFTVLSDTGNQLTGALGILTEPSPAAREAQLGGGLDLTVVNGDGTAGLPMPTTVIVDEAGQMRWIEVYPNYAIRTEPAAIRFDQSDPAMPGAWVGAEVPFGPGSTVSTMIE